MNYRVILLYTFVITAALVALFVLLDVLIGEQLLAFGRELVDQWGWPALFAAFSIAAVAIIPLPDHAISAFAMIGGMSDTVNIAAATSGSVTGAALAYYLGMSLRQSSWIEGLLQRHIEKWQPLIERHGVKALAVAALTPAPFSPACWISGILNIKFKQFLLVVTICRFLKVLMFLALLRFGLLNT